MKEQEPTRRYAIRKLTVGAASVLIGLAFANAKTTTVHADTVNGDTGQTAQNKSSDSGQGNQQMQTAHVVKTTAPQTASHTNSNIYTVSKHDAFFSGSGLSGDAFTLPNTKPDAKTGWETPDYNTSTGNQANSQTSSHANNKANASTVTGNTGSTNNNVQLGNRSSSNQGSTNVTTGNTTTINTGNGDNTGSNANSNANNTVSNVVNSSNSASKNQANRNVQDNIGDTGDVQGNGTVEKNENVRYVDRETGRDIANSSNVSVDFVPYFKKATGTITYRDAKSNQVLGTQTIHGYVGGQVTITTGQLEGYVNKGYKISSDTTLNQRFADGANNFTIDLNHDVITQGGRTVDTSQTVHFVDEAGNDLIDPKVQSDTFVYTPTITDKVTDDTTPGGKWNMVDKTFDDVTAPVIPGYLATVKSITGAHTTIDNPISSSVITYKCLGQMIPVIHNDNMGDDTGITDTNQKATIEISTAQHVYYTVDPDDPTKILTDQTPPDIDGYVPVNKTVTITDPFKDQEVVYTVDQNHQANKGDKQTVHEIINYIGPDGKSIWPATDNSFDFLIKNGQATNADDYTFGIKYPPVVDGYVADQGQIDQVTVKPGDKNKIITVKYSKVGNIIAVDENGKELTRVAYQNNPFDASAVRNDETPPSVPGYTPKDSTVSPVFPDQDTRVVYVRNAQGKHITINFVDTTTGGNIMSKTLTGVEGTPCTYNPASDIAYVRAQGYSLGDDLVPDNLIFGNEDMTYDINFGHKSVQMDPDDTSGFVDGSPVDPSSPYGAKGQLYDWKRETKHTVHYTGAGAATPKDIVQKNTWTRHFTIDEVTGAKTIVDDWQSSLGDNYSDVGTPVVQTYHADKQRIPTRRIKLNSDIDDTVTYKRNGRMILDFYDQNGVKLKTKKGPYWITDPGDPTAVMPNEKVPMFTDYVPMVRMITPESPDKDTHVAYVHVPDKIIVPVVPPNFPPPTAAMVVAAAEAQIGKPIEHPVIIARNKITKPSDLVYAYDETTGSQIGDNVKANWRKLQRRGSYYNNTQEGYDGKFFTKQSAADVNDRSNTPKSLNDGDQHDLTEAQYDSYHNGRMEDTEIKDEAKDKGITLHHKDGDDVTEIMFNKINHTETYTDNSQFRNTDLPDISNQVWENNKWNTDDFGNHYNPSPADTLGASAVALFALPASVNNINETALSANLLQTPSKNAVPVTARTQALKVEFGKNGQVNSVKPLAMSLVAVGTQDNSNSTSDVGSEDWEPTPYYAVVVNGKVVQTGLTKDQMQKYVAQHDLPDVSGYTPDSGQDTGISYESPDSSTKIIYYHKTGTQPGDNTSGSSGSHGGNTGSQGGGSGSQSGNTGNQGGNTGSQGGNPGSQGGNTSSQGGNAGNQGGNTGSQSGNTGSQGGNTGSQSGNTGSQGGTTGSQGGNAGNQSGNTDSQSGNTGSQGGSSGSLGGNSDNQGGNTGSQGSNTGSQGGNTSSQSGNSGSQGGNSGSQSGNSGSQGGNSGSQGGNSGSQGGNSGSQSGNSGSQGGNSGSQGGNSGSQSGNTGSQSGNSGSQGGNSGSQSGKSGSQGGNSGSQSGNSGSQGGNSGSQGGNSGSQSGNTGSQSGNTGSQGGNSGSPSGNTGSQGGSSGNQGGNTGSQSGNTGSQGGSSGNQGGNTGSQSGNTGSQGGNSDSPSGNTGSQGGSSGNQGGNTGSQSGNTGSQGGDTGSQSGNSGSQSGNSGSQGGNSGSQGGSIGSQSGNSGSQGGNTGYNTNGSNGSSNGSTNDSNTNTTQSGTTINDGALNWNQINNSDRQNGSSNNSFVDISTKGNTTSDTSSDYGKKAPGKSAHSKTSRDSNVSGKTNKAHLKNRRTTGTYTRGNHINSTRRTFVGQHYAIVNGRFVDVSDHPYITNLNGNYGANASYDSYGNVNNSTSSYVSSGYADNGTVYADTVSAGQGYNNSVVSINTNSSNGSASSVAQAQYQANSGYLPQTGNKQSMAVMALGLVLVSTSFGMVAFRKHS